MGNLTSFVFIPSTSALHSEHNVWLILGYRNLNDLTIQSDFYADSAVLGKQDPSKVRFSNRIDQAEPSFGLSQICSIFINFSFKFFKNWLPPPHASPFVLYEINIFNLFFSQNYKVA